VKKVLVVDDSSTVRQELRDGIGRAGFVVLEAANGAEGWDRAREHPDTSIVLLDVNMPVLGGLDLLDRLKADPKTAKIPVLMLTTEAEPALVARAKKAGASGWLIKPVKIEILVGALKKLTA
jgi:two-component system, chemotaxis family, chemotaxis protein CheY